MTIPKTDSGISTSINRPPGLVRRFYRDFALGSLGPIGLIIFALLLFFALMVSMRRGECNYYPKGK